MRKRAPILNNRSHFPFFIELKCHLNVLYFSGFPKCRRTSCLIRTDGFHANELQLQRLDPTFTPFNTDRSDERIRQTTFRRRQKSANGKIGHFFAARWSCCRWRHVRRWSRRRWSQIGFDFNFFVFLFLSQRLRRHHKIVSQIFTRFVRSYLFDIRPLFDVKFEPLCTDARCKYTWICWLRKINLQNKLNS